MVFLTIAFALNAVLFYVYLALAVKYRRRLNDLADRCARLQELYEEKDSLADTRQATILKRDARIRALENNLDTRAKERDRIQAALEKAEADYQQMKRKYEICAENRRIERKSLEDKLEHCEVFRQTVTPHIERQDVLIGTLEREKAELQAALEQQHKSAMLQENHLADEIQRLKLECSRIANACEAWKQAVESGSEAYNRLHNAAVCAHTNLSEVLQQG